MEEQIRTQTHQAHAAPPALGTIFDPVPDSQMVTVAAGPHAEQLPVANLRVADIRARLRYRFDIDPRSLAIIDAREVADDRVVQAGEVLIFAPRAGEKGGLPRMDLLRQLNGNGSAVRVVIEGATAHTLNAEGDEKSMPLAALLEKMQGLGTGDMVLPDGLKAMLAKGRYLVCVHQIPPRAHSLQWISADSPKPFGNGTSYRIVRIGLPYLVTMELFGPGPDGRLTLLNSNECFFRCAPLVSLDDPLLFPALLNCSKFDPPDGKPLAWICTQYLNREFDNEPREGQRLWKAHRALLHCLLETGFNLSSEHHEGNSWFNASRHVDPRVNSVEAWQNATAQDPLVGLEIPWVPTGLSVREMADRMFGLQPAHRTGRLDAANMARVILNQR